jgi:hypothetical protein
MEIEGGVPFQKEISVQLPEEETKTGQAKNNRCLQQMIYCTSAFP